MWRWQGWCACACAGAARGAAAVVAVALCSSTTTTATTTAVAQYGIAHGGAWAVLWSHCQPVGARGLVGMQQHVHPAPPHTVNAVFIALERVVHSAMRRVCSARVRLVCDASNASRSVRQDPVLSRRKDDSSEATTCCLRCAVGIGLIGRRPDIKCHVPVGFYLITMMTNPVFFAPEPASLHACTHLWPLLRSTHDAFTGSVGVPSNEMTVTVWPAEGGDAR